MSYLTCPFDAYFPLPLSEKLDEKRGLDLSAYNYCKTKLQSLVTELRLRKDRHRFHFYFGDSLESCSTNEDLKNEMHVIHCSGGVVELAGLANLLPIASGCLSTTMPEAVLVTEHALFRKEIKKPSLAEYVESELCCPLTMIPTVYGVRLWDQVHLGSSVCCQLHDHLMIAVPMTLKWYKAPISYSTEVRLEVSPSLKKVVSALVEHCFIQAHPFYYSPKVNDSFRSLFLHSKLLDNPVLRYTPLTFYNIIQPLLDRHNWLEGAFDLYVQQCLPIPYRLAWRTLKDGMEGKQVLLFYSNTSNIRDAIVNARNKSTDVSRVMFVLKPTNTDNSNRPGRIVGKSFYSNAHCVFHLNWKDSNTEDLTASFLLAKDYDLHPSTELFLIDAESKILLYSTSLTSMQRKVLNNRWPSRRALPPSLPSNPSLIVCCQESEEDFKLDFDLRRVKLQSSKGFYRIKIFIFPLFY